MISGGGDVHSSWCEGYLYPAGMLEYSAGGGVVGPPG